MAAEPYIEVIVNGPFQENCYLVGDPATRKAALIDPGFEAGRILGQLEQTGYTLEKITNTHAHIDHAGAVAEICERTGAQFYLHERERANLEGMPRFAQLFGMGGIRVPMIDRYLHESDEIAVGGLTLRVLETPGHTAGGCSLLLDGHLFVGDTVFNGSVGRTDLPGGDYDTLIESIQKKILPLPDETLLYPGHGPRTPLGFERKHNPFLVNPDFFRDQMA